MGKRGPKPKGKVRIEWSANFAYAIGLLVSDGNLSPDGRHITFVSKDVGQIENFVKALSINVMVGSSQSGYTANKAFRVQFGDVQFYDFLLSIGLMPNKSKIIGKVEIPPEYFLSFLRGVFDGDGSTHSYYDPRFKSSFMFYTIFSSASNDFIFWLQKEIFTHLSISGHITGKVDTIFQLKYAKADSMILLRALYPNNRIICLPRKRLKIKEMLRIIGQRL
jgi:hypothetical protein